MHWPIVNLDIEDLEAPIALAKVSCLVLVTRIQILRFKDIESFVFND